MKNPFISIIVPCYNQAQFLSECLESVLDQSFQEWECIIVDDGSPDNTEEVAREWCEKDRRFKYLKKSNGGPSSARNAGIAIAGGEWILPLDGDDKLSSDFLKEADFLIKKEPDVKLLYPNVILFGDENRKWNLPPYKYEDILWFNMIVCTSFYRKSDFEKTEGYNVDMREGWEDWDFWLSFLNENDKVISLPEATLYYRIKNVSRNKNVNDNNAKQDRLYWKIFDNHRDIYMKHESYISCALKKRDLETAYNYVTNSSDYKLGRLMMKPIHFLKKLFS